MPNRSPGAAAPEVDPFSDGFLPVVEHLGRIHPLGRVHPSQVTRWVLHGRDGVRIPALKIGGRWHSTPECVRWWLEKSSGYCCGRPANDTAAVDDELQARGYADPPKTKRRRKAAGA